MQWNMLNDLAEAMKALDGKKVGVDSTGMLARLNGHCSLPEASK